VTQFSTAIERVIAHDDGPITSVSH